MIKALTATPLLVPILAFIFPATCVVCTVCTVRRCDRDSLCTARRNHWQDVFKNSKDCIMKTGATARSFLVTYTLASHDQVCPIIEKNPYADVG